MMDLNFPLLDEDLDEPVGNVSPSGSAYDALYTLNPPSPILTPSQIAFTWSSGSIPVLLYDDGYVDTTDLECSVSLDESLAWTTPKHRRDSAQSQTTVRLTDGAIGNRISTINPATYIRRRISASSLKATDSGLGAMVSVESSDTICSVGTFGPRRRTLTQEEASGLKDPKPVDLFSDLRWSAQQGFPNHTLQKWLSEQVDDLVLADTSSPLQTISDLFSSPNAMIDWKPEPSDLNKNDPGPKSGDEQDSDGSLLTPKKPTLTRPISHVAPLTWGYGQYREHIKRESTPSPEPYEDSITKRHCTPPRREELVRLDNNSQIVETPRSGRTHDELPDHMIENRNLVSKSPPRERSGPAIRQGVKHDWLRDITIQFLVDQEGFRAAEPSFRFAGVARIRAPQTSKGSEATLMARFIPVMRQAFQFHCAPFETPPILRRVTVDNDETYDFVSRQALLTLKHNGVYVLHGQEMSSSAKSHLNDGEALKLHWQFEYLVDDRLTEASGRVMEGEKILTPLTFSCSPAVLLPAQGKKNTIMQVLKKSLAPKLVAEKLHPPGTLRVAPKGIERGNLPSSQTDAHISHFFSAKSKVQTGSLHRRGQSHGVRRAEDLEKATTPPNKAASPGSGDSTPDVQGLGQQPKASSRRRRNSSAGEHAESDVTLRVSAPLSSKPHREASGQEASAFTSPGRHIIPPAQLAKLLDSAEKENQRLSRASMARNSSDFMPLAPRPRHLHTLTKEGDVSHIH